MGQSVENDSGNVMQYIKGMEQELAKLRQKVTQLSGRCSKLHIPDNN